MPNEPQKPWSFKHYKESLAVAEALVLMMQVEGRCGILRSRVRHVTCNYIHSKCLSKHIIQHAPAENQIVWPNKPYV